MEAGLPVSLSRCEGNVKHRQNSMHSLFFFFVSVKTPSACKKITLCFQKGAHSDFGVLLLSAALQVPSPEAGWFCLET